MQGRDTLQAGEGYIAYRGLIIAIFLDVIAHLVKL